MAFERYETLMREFVEKCQGIADGGTDWFVPRTRFRLWLSTRMWKILPYTPWKNMMIEVPLKIGNSIHLKDYGLRKEVSSADPAMSGPYERTRLTDLF